MNDAHPLPPESPGASLAERTAAAVTGAYAKAPPWLRARTSLLIRAGSHASGLALPESDVDLRGLAIAPRASYLGFAHRFERFACEDPDCEVADIRFFVRAAAEGEPNALQVLFCDEQDVLVRDAAGDALRARRGDFVSQRVVKPFAGYVRGQVEKIKRSRGEIRDLAKSAMHACRLTRMLREVLVDGVVQIRRTDAEELVAIRLLADIEEVRRVGVRVEEELRSLPDWVASSVVPEQPDTEALNDLCVRLVSEATGFATP